MKFEQVAPFVLVLLFVSLLPLDLTAQRKKEIAIPDFTKGDSLPEGAKHDWNLGPTGARGWMYSSRLETTEARQVLITKIEKGSPADGVLKVGDVMLGVNDQKFSYDPRTELGKAIQSTEIAGGPISLLLWRDGSLESVTLKLETLGSYSATAPFACPKSKLIFEKGCEVLAERMKTNPKMNPIVRSLNALALLSSGKPEYLPIVREQVKWASQYSDPLARSLHCWYYGPVNLLLAEYTLATGDSTYLPDLKRVTMEIVAGQSNVGSWGHRFARPDGLLNGYGMMNAPGLPMIMSLVLARKAGVKDPELDLAIEKSARLIRFYVGKGSVPYGDHHPWIETHDDNGKNGIAALMFNVLGDAEAAEYFSRMSVASHSGEKEMGHTGNFLNMLWAMPSVALSGPEATGAWVNEFGWYYDLARKWDGSFEHQGPPQLKNDQYRGWDSTGAYLLAYAQPLRNLYITGKEQGNVTQISKQEANRLIADGRDYSHRLKHEAYSGRTVGQLLDGLKSWSPVVRERSAVSLANRDRKNEHIAAVIKMVKADDLFTRLGACQAIAHYKQRAGDAVPVLTQALDAKDLWLQVKAAEALAGIGKDARSVVPKMLSMLAEEPAASDPRGMLQRYLCFALFDRRNGLLKGPLDDIDRTALYEAVRAGLKNEDGRARGVLGSVYQRLTFAEIKPLLPAIHQAIVEPAPSGTMFADGIRLSGLELLAKHQVKEGLPLCIDLIELDRWGQGKRLKRCCKTLQQYGSAAKQYIPQLEDMKKVISAKRQNKNTKEQLKILDDTINAVSSSGSPGELRSLNDA